MAGLAPAISFQGTLLINDSAHFPAIAFWHAAQTLAGVAGMSM
jgi:hypothetical protein